MAHASLNAPMRLDEWETKAGVSRSMIHKNTIRRALHVEMVVGEIDEIVVEFANVHIICFVLCTGWQEYDLHGSREEARHKHMLLGLPHAKRDPQQLYARIFLS